MKISIEGLYSEQTISTLNAEADFFHLPEEEAENMSETMENVLMWIANQFTAAGYSPCHAMMNVICLHLTEVSEEKIVRLFRDSPYGRMKGVINQQINSISINSKEVGMTVRSRKALARLGVSTIGDIANVTSEQILEQNGSGMATLEVIREKISEYGLKLKGE
jgi:hypothetical protein